MCQTPHQPGLKLMNSMYCISPRTTEFTENTHTKTNLVQQNSTLPKLYPSESNPGHLHPAPTVQIVQQ